MTALTVLTMAQNQLVGEIPEGVGNLPQLTMLLLSHNQLSGDNSSR
jgi:Leucine-rich repeat (LRR) protein